MRGAKSGGRVASEDEAEAGHESAEGVRAGAAGVQVADEGAEGVGDQAEARYLAKCARGKTKGNKEEENVSISPQPPTYRWWIT